MTRFREFDMQERDQAEPLAFAIAGRKFACRPEIPDMVLLRIMSKLDGDAPVQAGAILDFFDAVIAPEDAEAFRAYVDDPDVQVPIETLGEIVLWLAGEYGSRPTKPSSASKPGP